MFEHGVQFKELLLAFVRHNIGCVCTCDGFLNPVSLAGLTCVYLQKSKQKSEKTVMLNLFQHLTNVQIGQKDGKDTINVHFVKPQILKRVQDDRGKCHSECSDESRKIVTTLRKEVMIC